MIYCLNLKFWVRHLMKYRDYLRATIREILSNPSH